MIRFLCVLFFLVSCSPYSVRVFERPDLPLFPEYNNPVAQAATSDTADSRDWWRSFEDPKLNLLVEQMLQQNLSLQAAWARLRQAQEQTAIAGSELFPQANIDAQGVRRRSEVSIPFETQFTQGVGTLYENNFSLVSDLSYELDIWRRIQSGRTAAALRAEAARADLEETAMVLIGSVVETWFQAQEQKALLQLLEEQITIGKTFLELTELRFAVGQGSALDVYQQREQLAATESQLPIAQSQYEQALNQLATLIGHSPGVLEEGEVRGDLVALPPFPELVTPAMLLETRPDLRRARFQLQAGEYDIAAAVADRFPRLGLNLNYNFQTNDLDDLFTQELGLIGSSISAPLIDGGRRRAEVRRRDAIVDELLASYGDSYLTALQDVENAVVQEKYQKELVGRLKKQTQAAEATLSESRSRYMNGLTDYLQVIVSMQALQQVQRQVVSERRGLLVARARLYRSIGGVWLQELEDTKETK